MPAWERGKRAALVSAKLQRGWRQLGSDPYDIVHATPPKQLPRYHSEPDLRATVTQYLTKQM